ncbi:MAG TPA: hypothetical protein PLL20_06485 [Phycisphaerae bacterium]|nr:hypothetical protein [Phycisphaerae bacterium]HRR85094.1 hypothetical protein [Phycisphaerae bacterium]
MAQKLTAFYEFVGANGGLEAKMRLAMMTAIPSNKAGEAPDSPENIAKFKDAVKKITGKDAPIA